MNISELGMTHRFNGSATISLIRVALGQAECFFEPMVASWDVFAGVIIITEAGGQVEHPPVLDFMTERGNVFAANGKISDLPLVL